MHRSIPTFAFFLAAACSTQQPPSASAPSASQPAPMAAPPTAHQEPVVAPPSSVPAALPPTRSLNNMGLALHRALRGEKGNLFFSGASIRMALAMTALGAKGQTFDEMAKALVLPTDVTQIRHAGQAAAGDWKTAAGKAELVIANRLWLDKSATLEKAFAEDAKVGFGAEPETVDFRGAADPSRKRINTWVSDTTKGKIKDLVPQGAVDALTRLVLTNAIYFKGQWVTAFDKSQTKDAPFQTESGSVTVPMMRKSGDFAYASNAKAELVQLDYRDSDLAMLIALPQPNVKLAEIETGLAAADVESWARSVNKEKLDLAMPRFSFSWGRSVKRYLEAMGMKTAFSAGADFTGVSKQPNDLYVSDVFHKAFVFVDEAGTEAAAATGTVMATLSLTMTKTVRVDRPFLFFIREKKNGDILFQGRVSNPKAS